MKVLFVYLAEFNGDSDEGFVKIGYGLKDRDYSKIINVEKRKMLISKMSKRGKSTVTNINHFFDNNIEFVITPSPEKDELIFGRLSNYFVFDTNDKDKSHHKRRFTKIDTIPHSGTRSSGVILRNSETIAGLDKILNKFKKRGIPPKETEEGKLKIIEKHKTRERDGAFANEAKEYKLNISRKCEGCESDVAKDYHLEPKRFLELHHIDPLAKRQINWITTINDVLLLCPNCHTAIHRYMARPEYRNSKIRKGEFQQIKKNN
ncbi:MAG: HNH endonuclease [Bacteroidetes bacterium]|nr:HNH endonuclease [Bacteroidota bacterium]